MSLATRRLACTLLACCSLAAQPLRAQLQPEPALTHGPPEPARAVSASPGSGAASASAAPSATAIEAEERRQRAIRLFDEGALDASLLEFKRAYDLSPTYRLLFNLALVSLRLHDDAGAIGYFERYLQQGGSAIEPGRRRSVIARVLELSRRVGLVRVNVNRNGAEVSVDDRVVGVSPLPGPLRLNAGFHRLSAQTGQGVAVSRSVEVAGGDNINVGLVLPEPQRDIPWLAWGGTALLAGGAVVAGINAVGARHDFEDKRAQPNLAPNELPDAYDEAKRWSIAADVLGLAAVGLGVYSVILTLQPAEEPSEAPGGGSLPVPLELELGAHGLGVRGAF